MAKKGKYRTFLISMPQELIPIYDFVQRKLNQFLSDPVFRSKLLALDFSKHRGNVWRDIRDIVGKIASLIVASFCQTLVAYAAAAYISFAVL